MLLGLLATSCATKPATEQASAQPPEPSQPASLPSPGEAPAKVMDTKKADQGVIRVTTAKPGAEVFLALRAAIEQAPPISLMATIEHAENANKAGLTEDPTWGLVLGNPGGIDKYGWAVSSGLVAWTGYTQDGDFDADIISYAGGIGTVRINNGSLLPGNMITAFDGSISEVIIDSGHLLGNIHADQSIFSVRVIASADGVFGDIGINPALSAGVAADTFRNQLPSTALVSTDINGPRITANVNIGTIETTSGGMFEAFIDACNGVIAEGAPVPRHR